MWLGLPGQPTKAVCVQVALPAYKPRVCVCAVCGPPHPPGLPGLPEVGVLCSQLRRPLLRQAAGADGKGAGQGTGGQVAVVHGPKSLATMLAARGGGGGRNGRAGGGSSGGQRSNHLGEGQQGGGEEGYVCKKK